ncbi:uncharacterized protein EAF02_001059 [Botrytis sinoallii]|uniref:uncharacterized protein n=1 Tax=Botrytis sinoallii TaxID=1463999 RepID=UPI0019013FC9|nr:uncharacterized protein EAF02_001059 [Botrytis sinoallii]KAF7893521.1 hypothetical protein EAF02_001059 [Botrytis sinoallii]
MISIVSQAAIMPFKQKGNVLRSTIETSPLVIANADNYAWFTRFANEVCWSNQCGHGFATPRDNIFAPPGAGNVSGKKRDGPAEGDRLGH